MKENSTVTPVDSVQDENEKNPVLCLLVDDVLLNLTVLAAMIKKMGCVPVVVNSAEEALATLAGNKFQMILTDLWMPEMDGMEFAKIVRQNLEYKNIPIIAVTADVEYEKNFDMRYFDNVIVKPVTLQKLRAGLKRYKI